MTWYATEVLARCNDALLSAVMQDSRLATYSYLIKEPVEYSINGAESVFHPPEGGLLVIRPICNPNTHCANWHESKILSWHSLCGSPSTSAIHPQALREYVNDAEIGEFPPMDFFRYLKDLAEEAKTDLVFFYCFMWGGDTEAEYSWFFGQREEISVVLESGVPSKIARYKAGGQVELVKMDLLSDVLAYLGAPIPSPFCVMHTRGFPWEHFKVASA